MGLSRRFLNLVVENRTVPGAGAKSLCCMDLNERRHSLFFDTATPPPARNSNKKKVTTGTLTQTRAPKGNANALVLNKFRVPSASLSMRASDFDTKEDQRVHFFPAAMDRRAFCLDQLGRVFLLEADPPRVVMMPRLHRPKLEPISLYVPCTGPDFDDADGVGGGNLYIMDRRVAKPKPEPPGGVNVNDGGGVLQFEALVYRRPSLGGFNSKTWHCDLLPPLPPHNRHGGLEISSYALVDSKVCISLDGDGTYYLAAGAGSSRDTYCWSEVGKWTLPFQGEAHYAPELKLWFGFTAEDHNLAAADLSAMDCPHFQPHVLESWKEFEPPKGWQQVQDPQLVSLGSPIRAAHDREKCLGSGMFCIARYFRTGTAMDDCQNVTVLTGVEVLRGFNPYPGKVDLRIVKHKSLCHKSGCGEDTITAVC